MIKTTNLTPRLWDQSPSSSSDRTQLDTRIFQKMKVKDSLACESRYWKIPWDGDLTIQCQSHADNAVESELIEVQI